MTQVSSEFGMSAENAELALRDYRSYVAKQNEGKKHIWQRLDMPSTVEDMFDVIGFLVYLDDNRNVYKVWWASDKYWSGVDPFMNIIAPYVDEGSFIEMSGDDGDRWRWYFADNRCEKQEPKIVY